MNDKVNQGGYPHENQTVQHGTDYRHPERGGGRSTGQGTLPQARLQRCDDLQLVADQALDIQILREIVSKKS
jgi:hypothetical protein